MTWSPYHWCAISCTSTSGDVAYVVSPSVIMVWVSMPLSESTITNPSGSNGNGPSRSSSQSNPARASRSFVDQLGLPARRPVADRDPAAESSFVSTRSSIAIVTR